MGELDQELIGPPLQVIAPWLSTITELHKDKHKEITSSATQTSDRLTYRPPPNDYEPQYDDDNTPLVVRRPQRLPKPTNRLIESREYLSRPHTFAVDTDT